MFVARENPAKASIVEQHQNIIPRKKEKKSRRNEDDLPILLGFRGAAILRPVPVGATCQLQKSCSDVTPPIKVFGGAPQNRTGAIIDELGAIFQLSLGSALRENGQPAARNVKQRGFSRILNIGFAFVKSGDKPAASLLRLCGVTR